LEHDNGLNRLYSVDGPTISILRHGVFTSRKHRSCRLQCVKADGKDETRCSFRRLIRRCVLATTPLDRYQVNSVTERRMWACPHSGTWSVLDRGVMQHRRRLQGMHQSLSHTWSIGWYWHQRAWRLAIGSPTISVWCWPVHTSSNSGPSSGLSWWIDSASWRQIPYARDSCEVTAPHQRSRMMVRSSGSSTRSHRACRITSLGRPSCPFNRCRPHS